MPFYILLFNSLIFEFKELIPILKLSSFPSIRTSKYIVTIAGKPKLATNCIKSSSNDIFLQIIFSIAKKAPHKLRRAFLCFMCYAATTKSNSVVSV